MRRFVYLSLLIVSLLVIAPHYSSAQERAEYQVIKPKTVLTTNDGKINVRISWEPENPVINDNIIMTFEFLNKDNTTLLNDVTYSVHMSMNGNGLNHGHQSHTQDGVAIIEQKIINSGRLDVILEIHSINSIDISQFVQFSIKVSP